MPEHRRPQGGGFFVTHTVYRLYWFIVICLSL